MRGDCRSPSDAATRRRPAPILPEVTKLKFAVTGCAAPWAPRHLRVADEEVEVARLASRGRHQPSARDRDHDR
jgi:hypothetical protein